MCVTPTVPIFSGFGFVAKGLACFEPHGGFSCRNMFVDSTTMTMNAAKRGVAKLVLLGIDRYLLFSRPVGLGLLGSNR